MARFAADPDIAGRFSEVFPRESAPVSIANAVKAIAAFERTLVSGNSVVDRYLYGDDRTALTPSAVRGMRLFFSERLSCAECHGGFNLSGPSDHEGASPADLKFHNTGLYDVDGEGSYPAIDRGLIDLTRNPQDMGRFRAPTLRNIALTAPYMHDGSVPDLRAAIAHYALGGRPSRYRHPRLKGFRISADETNDLISFLESLTDYDFIRNPDLAPVR